MRHISDSKTIQIWLKKACSSDVSVATYLDKIKGFFQHVSMEPDELLSEWKRVKYDLRSREEFIDEWTEKIEGYVHSSIFDNYTPLSKNQILAIIVSFFRHHRIPVSVNRLSRLYVKYHNRDLKREEIERVLEHADLRARAFFLMMLESGLRPYTLVQLRYKHIKEDFRANRVPMKVELPSELLKDRVEPRWTFIGRDGFKTLREYLKPRLPLFSDDLIFIPERKTKHEFLKPHTFSNIFGKIALKLGITERTVKGKPKEIRLYCLRKYFMNNIRCDTAFREFWMGHKTTQTHYVSRDVERHREEYSNAYENLRVYKPEQPQRVRELERLLVERDKTISDMRWKIRRLMADFTGRYEKAGKQQQQKAEA